MARPKTLSADEKKSARASLLMTPKLSADVSTLARIQKVSVNQLLCTLAEQAVKKNRLAIDKAQAGINDVSATIDLTLDDCVEQP